ncbi:MAG: TolC family protein [Alphaproteobacteria bacterium]|nr:TolC family protein [Alphaproteobacteria bacterium]
MNYKSCLFIILCSCSVGPDYSYEKFFDDEEIQKSINLNKIENDREKYSFSLYDFNDISLNKLMDEVQENSSTIKIAILKLKQARESLSIAFKNNLLYFDFTGKYNFINENKNSNNLMGTDYYQTGLDASWELDIFGGGRRKTESEKAKYMAMVYNLKNVNVSLVSEVAINYINLRNVEQQIQNAKENLEMQEEAYNLINDQYKVSLADEITLSQSKYLLETTKMSIPKLEYQKSMYENALSILLGKLPESINPILEETDKNIINQAFDLDINRLYDLPVSVVRNRPDVKIAEENIIAQNAEIGVAISKLYPSVSLSSFFGFQSLKWSNLVDNDSWVNSFIPAVNLPIFHWGQLNNNVRLQKYLKEEAVLSYKKVLLNAIAEIKNSIKAVEKGFEIGQAATKAFENMKIVSELNWKKYKLGLIGYNDVLDAEQRRISAQADMVNANANLYLSLVNFYKAIGGRPLKGMENGEK